MIIDLLIIVALGIGGYLGYKDGLLAQVVSLLHAVLAFMIAFKAVGFLLKLINTYIFEFDAKLFPYIGLLSATIATFVLLERVGKYFKTEIEYDMPGEWDNIVGAILGVMRYAFVISFAFWFIEGFGTLKITDGNTIQKRGIINPYIKAIAFKVSGSQTQRQLAEKITAAL